MEEYTKGRLTMTKSKMQHHASQEIAFWQQAQTAETEKIRASRRHLVYNVLAYLLISIIEYILATIGKSQTLKADAFNNLSGIISSVLLMMGLYIAEGKGSIASRDNKKKRHHPQLRSQMVRWRYETIFSLITSIIMVVIAFSVIGNGIKSLIEPAGRVVPQPVAIIGAAIASVIMLVVWYMNRRAGHKLQNAALLASAQDSLTDAFTSIGTMVAIAGALFFKLSWLDGATSIIVGFLILYSGMQIYFSSSLNLADYFDPRLEKEYAAAVAGIDGITKVIGLHAHYNGNVINVNGVLMVDGQIKVVRSYQLAEQAKNLLREKYGIVDAEFTFFPDPRTFDDNDIQGNL